jgi:hypothetical protein
MNKYSKEFLKLYPQYDEKYIKWLKNKGSKRSKSSMSIKVSKGNKRISRNRKKLQKN